MTIKNVNIGLLAFVVSSVFTPVTGSEIEKDIKSTNVLIKEVKTSKQNYDLLFYSKPSVGFYKNIDNADYVYLWHGKDQVPYSLLSVTGLSNLATEDSIRIAFMGIEQEAFTRGETKKLNRLLEVLKRPYVKELPYRRQYSVGYDLGVAGAFLSACKNEFYGAVISSGGIYDDETCKPKNLKVMYSINKGDLVYPKNKDTMFVAQKTYSLKNRLDGDRSLQKIIELMDCKPQPLTEMNRGASVKTYGCENGNDLIFLTHDVQHHQWNGYLLAEEGTFNQFGTPHYAPLSRWIYDKMDLR